MLVIVNFETSKRYQQIHAACVDSENCTRIVQAIYIYCMAYNCSINEVVVSCIGFSLVDSCVGKKETRELN